jgi:hypothetical protein
VTRWALLVTVVAALIGCGNGGPAGLKFNTRDGCPYWSPDGKWFAFERGPIDSFMQDVHLVDRQGMHLRRLTHTAAYHRDVVVGWLEAPKRVIFSRGAGLFALRIIANSRAVRIGRLRVNDTPLALSRDRTRLLVENQAPGIDSPVRYAVLEIGSGRRRTQLPDEGVHEGVWSPKNRRSPDGRTYVYPNSDGLRAVQIGDKEYQQLTSSGSYYDECPSFSPEVAALHSRVGA